MKYRISALLAAVTAVTVLNACGDSLTPVTPIDTVERQLTLFALNGTDVTLPSSILVLGPLAQPQPKRIDANFAFDVAFDIKSADSVAIHTVAFVANQLTSTHRVGLQRTDQTFDAAVRAPTTGYVYDSTLTVGLGRTVFVDVFESTCSLSFNGPSVRAKIKVDSLDLARRVLYVDILSDPNCGFRTLSIGKPKD
jgi:hypothetical protein